MEQPGMLLVPVPDVPDAPGSATVEQPGTRPEALATPAHLQGTDQQVRSMVDRTGVAPAGEASKGLLVTASRPCPAAPARHVTARLTGLPSPRRSSVKVVAAGA